MKLNKPALTLIAAALLPTFAYAGADTIADSFDRSFINEAFINTSCAGTNQIAASFERDLLGNAAIAAQDPVLASFEHDLYREPVTVAAAVVQGDDAFIINEPDTILANFYRELHWMPGISAVYVR